MYLFCAALNADATIFIAIIPPPLYLFLSFFFPFLYRPKAFVLQRLIRSNRFVNNFELAGNVRWTVRVDHIYIYTRGGSASRRKKEDSAVGMYSVYETSFKSWKHYSIPFYLAYNPLPSSCEKVPSSLKLFDGGSNLTLVSTVVKDNSLEITFASPFKWPSEAGKRRIVEEV